MTPPSKQPNDPAAAAPTTAYVKPAPNSESQLPFTLGRYELVELLGAGGMGRVYKARHRAMDRIVAVKILAHPTRNGFSLVERFRREVKAAGRLEHPNVVTVHDAGEHEGVPFLVMQYVPGRDLAALVRDDGPMAPAQAVGAVVGAARGLAHAHRMGVIHRDVKPSNLLLTDSGDVKVLDLGLSKLRQDSAMDPSPAMTATGAVMGTVDYMAPEQAADVRAVDERADVYGLGATLYFLLMGRPMYAGDTAMQRLLAHRERPVPSLAAGRGDVPTSLEMVYRKMVAKRPQDRYQSMAEAAAALEACLTGLGTAAGGPALAPTGAVVESAATSFLGPKRDLAQRSWLGPWMAVALGGVVALTVLGALAWWILASWITHPASVAGGGKTAASGADRPGDPPKAPAQPSDWALYFDGNDASVQVSTLTLPRGPYTVELWLTSEKTPGEGFIVNSVGPSNIVLLDRGDRGELSFTWSADDVVNFTVAPFARYVHKRVHVAAVWDGQRPRLFVGGVDVTGNIATFNGAGPPGMYTLIGGSGTQGQANFRGTIYQARFSKTARYAGVFEPPQRFETDADTLALYRFDEGAGAILSDGSGHGHTGTIVRAKWVRADSP